MIEEQNMNKNTENLLKQRYIFENIIKWINF